MLDGLVLGSRINTGTAFIFSKKTSEYVVPGNRGCYRRMKLYGADKLAKGLFGLHLNKYLLLY